MSPGYGYSGIVIAMLAGLNPLGVVLAALFVAGLIVGADSMSRAVGRPDLSGRRDRRGVPAVDAGRDHAGPLQGALVMTEVFDIVASTAFWVAVLRIATPLIFGTLGVLLCERAGVLNLGIEGIMVAGAFSGWLAVYHGAGLWTGVLVAAATGALIGVLHGLLTVVLALSQHVTGLGITLFATSLSYYAYRVSFPKVNSPPTVTTFARDALFDAPAGHRTHRSARRRRSRCSRWSSCRSSRYVLYRTPVGLAVRTVGENPAAAEGQGISVIGGAHRRHRRRQRADGRGRRVSHAVRVQRLLLQHGQRARLDLRRAGGVRVLAAGQGAARRDPVRRLRRAAAAPAAELRRACCPTRST